MAQNRLIQRKVFHIDAMRSTARLMGLRRHIGSNGNVGAASQEHALRTRMEYAVAACVLLKPSTSGGP
jgi:hypothetical protein